MTNDFPSLSAPSSSLGAPLHKAETSPRSPIKHSHLRRKANYDYCARGMYLITVTTTGRDLQGCIEGFLLVLAPYAQYSDETREARISRAQCLNMNDYAADIATFAISREAPNE